MGMDTGDPRDYKDRLVDRLLLLHLFDRVSESNRITGDVKLQKLVFLSERSMIEDAVDGLKYSFFRWEHGPMSKGVYEDHEFLCEQRLVSEESGTILSRGKDVLDQTTPILSENSDIITEIDSVVDRYGGFSGYELKNAVYDMNVQLMDSGEVMPVEDIPKGTDIFWRVPEENAQRSLELTDEWAETLDILFDQNARMSVDQAVENARSEPSSEFVI